MPLSTILAVKNIPNINDSVATMQPKRQSNGRCHFINRIVLLCNIYYSVFSLSFRRVIKLLVLHTDCPTFDYDAIVLSSKSDSDFVDTICQELETDEHGIRLLVPHRDLPQLSTRSTDINQYIEHRYSWYRTIRTITAFNQVHRPQPVHLTQVKLTLNYSNYQSFQIGSQTSASTLNTGLADIELFEILQLSTRSTGLNQYIEPPV